MESINDTYLSALLSGLDLHLIPLVFNTGGEEAEKLLQDMGERPGCFPSLEIDENADPVITLKDDVREQIETLRSVSARNGVSLLFDRFLEVFPLSETETFFFLMCLAVSADPRYSRAYALIQGNERVFPSAELLLRLTMPNGLDRIGALQYLQEDHSLLKNCLIETIPGSGTELSVCYRPAPGIIDFLSGSWRSDFYHERARWIREPDQLYPELTEPYDITYQPDADGNWPMISIFGKDSLLQETFAETKAAEADKGLFCLDLSKSENADERTRLIRLALRDAALLNSVLLISGIDDLIDIYGIIPASFAGLFENSELPVIFSTRKRFIFESYGNRKERLLIAIPFEPLTGSQRAIVWKQELADSDAGAMIPDETIQEISGRFFLTLEQIRSAIRAGESEALRKGTPLGRDELFWGARRSSVQSLSELANLMPPRYNMGDLILPDAQKEQLNELISMAKYRSMVLEDLGVGKKLAASSGISALFTGDPGTGKTLSAQVIAGELGMDIYRIDLSMTVSKYIGETEKNLEKIFSEAQSSNVILFFDEADALFGKRSEVDDSKDRYANIEVGYLLQRIETYDGLAILATNLGANMDAAFTRRINFIIDFPFPDEETRLKLWQMLLPGNIRKDPGLDLKIFADTYRIAGGNIRNAIVTGIYRAAARDGILTAEDLLHGVEREYQKMGRVFR